MDLETSVLRIREGSALKPYSSAKNVFNSPTVEQVENMEVGSSKAVNSLSLEVIEMVKRESMPRSEKFASSTKSETETPASAAMACRMTEKDWRDGVSVIVNSGIL